MHGTSRLYRTASAKHRNRLDRAPVDTPATRRPTPQTGAAIDRMQTNRFLSSTRRVFEPEVRTGGTGRKPLRVDMPAKDLAAQFPQRLAQPRFRGGAEVGGIAPTAGVSATILAHVELAPRKRTEAAPRQRLRGQVRPVA